MHHLNGKNVTDKHFYKILFCTQNPVDYMSPPRLGEQQIVCGPFVEDMIEQGKLAGIKTPAGEYDLAEIVKRIPLEQRPDLIVVKSDAARNNFPRNLAACGVPAVLILGDTTHMKSPLEVMLRYAASEPYALYVTDHKRHHLHWFQNFGLGPVAWTPGLFVKDFEIPFKRHRDVPVSFVGQAGKFHPWRSFMLQELEKRGIKITKGRASQKDAAAIYARSKATLNFSLNADLNLRVFEVLAAGGCLVTDRLPPQAGLDILFTPGQDFLWYDGLEDLLLILGDLKKSPTPFLEVAESGHRIFQERHRPDIKRRDFFETVLAGAGRGTFDLPLDPRGEACEMLDKTSFFSRVSQYEWFQEKHRCCENLKIEFFPGADLSLACDLVDLPRHQVYARNKFHPLFEKAGVAHQIHEAVESMECDVCVLGCKDEMPCEAPVLLVSDFALLSESERQATRASIQSFGYVPEEAPMGFFRKVKPEVVELSVSNLAMNPTIERAVSEFQNGRLAVAEDICREILAKDERCAGAWHLMGKMAALQGDLEVAGEFVSVASELDCQNAEFVRELAEVFLRKMELEPAEQKARRALEMTPDSPEGLVLLGRVLAEREDKSASLQAFQDALRLKKDYADGFSHYALALQKFGRGKDAISQIRKACALEPDSVEFQTNLAIILEQNVRYVDALAAYGKAARMNPNVGFVWFRQGKLLNGIKRYTESIPVLEKAISLPGQLGDFYYEYGLALHMTKHFQEALAHYEKALSMGYETAALHCNRGVIYKDLRKGGDSIMAFHKAVTMDPSNVSYLNNLGAAALELGLNSEALECFEQAVEKNPKLPTARNNIGNLLKDRARGMDALPQYRKSIELNPDDRDAPSNYLLCHMYIPDIDPKMVFEEHKKWGLSTTKKFPPAFKFKPREASAKIRIGFLSADLCHHPVAHFIEPIFRGYDRGRFEFVAYGDQRKSDEFSARFATQVDLWRETASYDDRALAKLVYEDRVDILFELAGHTAYNRLGVFALKPAPLQVGYLGYPGSTGLPTIDFRITDAFADPLGTTEHLHTEKLIRVPECAWCFEPDATAPEVEPLPALKNGHVTFGCFNNMAKLNPALFQTWSEILLRVPGSHLRLKARTLTDDGVRKELMAYFTGCGIEEDRLDFFGHTRKIVDHLNHYHAVDIALDSFPYHGTTTTCEAMWMGCPVVTRAGKAHVSRVGVSLLNAVELQEFIAETREDYIEKAVALAGHTGRLAELRAGMRERLRRSVLMDEKRFVQGFEKALDEIAALGGMARL